MKVLITGGAGYLGSVIVGKLLNAGDEVVVLDKLLFNQTSLLQYTSNPNFKFIYGDVRNESLLEKLCKEADAIIPLAAIVGFPACAADPQLAKEINFKQIVNIVRFSKGKKILYPNTNSGYGIAEGQTECTEESPLTPISVYGQTKCDAENFLRTSTDAITFRLATVFGVSPRMRTDLLVNDFTYKAITDKYIVVFERNFKRNFIHVEDVASAFLFMLYGYEFYKGEVFNVGLSSANLSKQELLEKIQSHVNDFAVSYNDYYEDPDKRDYIVSNAKIEETGWKPEWDLDRGIKQLIQGYQMIVPKMGSEFRNGFPLGYANNT
ncbi:NAD(P)-dependent oxidoreductase [archaeon]|jgi:nucleoside-diphosphate-sugar epimerase|nr:NAD(P)-dependent oxidoreductase [archaeon]NDB55143.1 NAD(P)-dependent oxidoreductase [archaeon]NDB79011.1 NAD(P)-dependent oxidoreductase [archaeon]